MQLGQIVKSAIGAIALSIFAATTVQADVQQELGAASVVEQIKQRGVLKVGVSTFVPWAMRDKKGDLIGFEIDVVKKLADDMEVGVEFIPTAWSGIIPALIGGKFDVIISGMSITTQRNMTVNFTIPYAHSGPQLAANKELADGFSLDDFNATNVVLTCRRGSSACDVAQEQFPKADLRRFDDDAQGFQEVINGNAHGSIASAPKPQFVMLENPGVLFLPSEKTLTQFNEAFALRKGDPDALNFFSNWILVNTDNGWLAKTHDYWFKTRDWADEVGPDQ